MPLNVENLFVHGLVGPIKWLVQPESTIASVLGTKVRGAVFFATFSLYLVPSHSQLGLFLAEPPFVSDFFCALVMPGSRFFVILAGMVQGITMSPEVVLISGVGWPCAGIFVDISQGSSEFGDILNCFD